MATNFAAAGGGGWKRCRVDKEEGPLEAALTKAIPIDQISVLHDELRQRILTHLSLKEAIRTGVLARSWRDLWKTRWAPRSSVEIHLRSRAAVARELDALESERRSLRRLDSFSLIVDGCKLCSTELRRFLDYAADCCVEELHVETRNTTVAEELNFHLPRSSPLLARLSLCRIGISSRFYKGAQPLPALESIRLHSVYNISQTDVSKMMALCPSLLSLHLRDCDPDTFFYCHLVYPPKLRSITMVECEGQASLDLVHVPSLRSFRYSACDRSFLLPMDSALADLCICIEFSISEISYFNMALPRDLSGLIVLTICSNVLMVASSSWHYVQPEQVPWEDSSLLEQRIAYADDVSAAQTPKLCKLQSLRELQLLLKLKSYNLAKIYMFLKTCQCPNLERIFVQLPTFNCEQMKTSTDELVEEPPEGVLNNLKLVKITNFHWRNIEVQLLSFLLRKVSSLHTLLVVSPNVAPLVRPGVQEADLLLIKEAISNGKIMLRESDDGAVQPYHSEVFI